MTARSSTTAYSVVMNEDRIGEAVMALLCLSIHEGHPMGDARTRKSFDRDAMDGLHRKGLISDPV